MIASEPLLPSATWRRNSLSVLILFHLIVVPLGSALSVQRANPTPLERFLINYVFAIRAKQYWALFSPEPRRYALRYHAEIMFRDGRITLWQRPYPPNWNFFQRHLAYNFQKWDLVSNFLDQKSSLWDGLVDFLLKNYRNDANPVVKIRFLRDTADWPAPNIHGYVGGDRENLVWNVTPLFIFDVRTRRFL